VRVAVARDSGGPRLQRAVIDAAGALPGRGAYLCRGAGPGAPDRDCLQHATRRGAVARALRRNVKLDVGYPSVETTNS
jgi:predicted RNA-binding protein YlxR (DUF448 family)